MLVVSEFHAVSALEAENRITCLGITVSSYHLVHHDYHDRLVNAILTNKHRLFS